MFRMSGFIIPLVLLVIVFSSCLTQNPPGGERSLIKEQKVVPVIQSGHSNINSSVAFSPDGKYFASGSMDGTAYIWRTSDGVKLRSLDTESFVYDIAWSPEGSSVAVLHDQGKKISVFDVATGKRLRDMNYSQDNHDDYWDFEFIKIQYTSDGAGIVGVGGLFTSDMDRYRLPLIPTKCDGTKGRITFWDAGTGRCVRAKTTPYIVSSIDINRNLDYWITGGFDGYIRFWEPDSLKEIKTIDTGSKVIAVAISPDGGYVASGNIDGSTNVWEADSRSQIVSHTVVCVPVHAVEFTPDSALVLSGGGGQSGEMNILTWDIFKNREAGRISSRDFGTYDMQISPDRDKLLVAHGSAERIWTSSLSSVSLYNLNNGELVYSLETENPHFYSSEIRPDGNEVAAAIAFNKTGGSKEGESRFLNLLSGYVESIPNIGIRDIEYSPDGRLFVVHSTASGDRDIVSLYESATKKKIDEVCLNQASSGQTLSFHPQGEYFTVGYPKIRILRIENGRLILEKTLDHNLVTGSAGRYNGSVFFSPDGAYLLTGCTFLGKPAVLWDTETWEPVQIYNRDNSEEYFGMMKSGNPFHPVGNSFYSNNGKYMIGSSNRVMPIPWLNTIVWVSGSEYYGDFRTNIELRNSNRSEPIKILSGHSGFIFNLAHNADKDLLLTSSVDGAMILWDLENDRHLTISLFDDNEWFIIDEDGHFDCSSRGNDHIMFVDGMESYEPDQFWNDFFTTNLLARFVNRENLGEIELTSYISRIPEVFITNLDSLNGTETEKDEITLDVDVRDTGGGIGDIFLYHNGKIIGENTRGLSVTRTGDARRFTIKLAEGENTVQAAAFDSRRGVEGRSTELHIVYKPTEVLRPDMHILTIGVSDYKDPGIRLESPDDDARVIADLFGETGKTIYDTIHTYLLVDDEATTENIMNAFQNLLDTVGTNDTVILFFAGHGYTEDKIYYYFPYEADLADLNGTCLSITQIGEIVTNLAANKIALFFDTCQSGSAAKSIGTIAMSRGVEERKAIADLAKQTGIIVFSAAASDAAAFEISSLGNGIFTYSIITAMTEYKDSITSDEYISISKLVAEVERLTRQTAYEYLKIDQTPVKYSFGEDFSIGTIE